MHDSVIRNLRKELEENNQQLEKVKSTILVRKMSCNIQKGEKSLHVGKNVKVEPKNPTKSNVIHKQ